MIGLFFLPIKLMVWMVKISIGVGIAMVALMVWFVLAMFLLLPGDKRGIRRSMNEATRTAHRGLGMVL